MGSRKKIVRGGARPKIPPKTYGKRDPPHGENGLYVERNYSAHIEKKYPHRGNCFPHIKLFYSCSPPPPPGRAPFTLFHLFEIVRKKINQQIFSISFT